MNTQYYTITPMANKDFYSWQPQALTNTKIHSDAGITSNWKYRQYLQNNAKDIMKYNTSEYIHASGNNPYTIVNNHPVQQNPYVFGSLYNNSQPQIIGQMSDLKQDFIKKQQIQARMIAPSIPTNF
jgi:hypothetical protein